MPAGFTEQSREYAELKKQNPELSYAVYWNQLQLERVRNGGNHATLGSRLNKGLDDWWSAGAKPFDRFLKLSKASPASKLVDYGCGSLRIGGHFIKYLESGHYYGLDLTDDFIDMGKDLIGEHLLATKSPLFATIDEKSMDDAVAFGADVVLSAGVCYHVHPDELSLYFSNLDRLTSKKGATLLFDAAVSDVHTSVRVVTWPVDFFVSKLPGLEMVKFHKAAAREEGEIRFELGTMEFRRP